MDYEGDLLWSMRNAFPSEMLGFRFWSMVVVMIFSGKVEIGVQKESEWLSVRFASEGVGFGNRFS